MAIELQIIKELSGFKEATLNSKLVDEIYKKSLETICKTLKCQFSFIYLLTKENQYELKFEHIESKNFPFNKTYYSEEIICGNISPSEIEKENYHEFSRQTDSVKSKVLFASLKNDYRQFGIIGVIVSETVENDDLVLTEIANVTSLLITNKKRNDKVLFVLETFEEVANKKEKKEIFQLLADRLTCPSSKFNACIIHLFDDVEQNLYGFVSSGIQFKLETTSRVNPGNGVIGEVFKTGKTSIVKMEETRGPYTEWSQKNGFLSMLTIQLKSSNDEPFGALTLFTKYIFKDNIDDKIFLDTFLKQISQVVYSILYEERIRRLSFVDSIISKIMPLEVKPIEILKILLDETLSHLNGNLGYVALFTKDSDKINVTYKNDRTGKYADFDVPDLYLELTKKPSISGWVVENKRGFFYPSPLDEINDFFVDYINLGGEIIKNEILVPLIYEDEAIGILVLSSLKAHTFEFKDLHFLEKTVQKVVQIIQSRIFYDNSIILNSVKFQPSDNTLDEDSESDQTDYYEREICKNTALITNQILETPVCCVWLIQTDSESEFLELKGWGGCTLEKSDSRIITKEQKGLSWKVINEARQLADKQFFITHHDIQNPDKGFLHIEFARRLGLDSMISVPIIRKKMVIGVINAYTKRNYNFFKTESVLLKSIAIRCGNALANANLIDKNEELMAKWSEANLLANPGMVALSFVHDINHTIHDLNGNADLLHSFIAKDSKNFKNIEEILEVFTTHTDSLAKYFRSLLNIGRKKEEKKRPANIKRIVDDVEHLFQRRFQVNKIKFSYVSEDAAFKINCYPSEVEQMLVNMMLNSITALKDETHRVREIKISSFRNKSQPRFYTFEVFDNGIGIKKDDESKIYNLNFSTKGEEGTGFGLSIVKRIVEHHSGNISHKSKFGTETTFIINLPVE